MSKRTCGWAVRRGSVLSRSTEGAWRIVTSMGTSILGNYPVGQHWQASMGVVTCMGAGAGIATLALKASELPLNNRS